VVDCPAGLRPLSFSGIAGGERNVSSHARIGTNLCCPARLRQSRRLARSRPKPSRSAAPCRPPALRAGAGSPCRISLAQQSQRFSPGSGGRTFTGTVTQPAGGLDPATRTLIAEVQLANPGGILRPGMFVQVNILSNRSHPPVLIRGDALILRSDGTHVAVLRDVNRQPRQPHNKLRGTLRIQPVRVWRDYGAAGAEPQPGESEEKQPSSMKKRGPGY
jgi:hypothetical protein